MSEIPTFLQPKSSKGPSHAVPKTVARWRATVASLSRSRSADDPDLLAARRNLGVAGAYEALRANLEGLTLSPLEARHFVLLISEATDAAAE